MRQTSLKAYQELKEEPIYLNDMYRYIIGCLLHHGPQTDREITNRLRFTDPNKVRPRRNELSRKGIVKQVGKRVCEISGKVALTWSVENG